MSRTFSIAAYNASGVNRSPTEQLPSIRRLATSLTDPPHLRIRIKRVTTLLLHLTLPPPIRKPPLQDRHIRSPRTLRLRISSRPLAHLPHLVLVLRLSVQHPRHQHPTQPLMRRQRRP